jgi:hypothetical protein
MDTEKFEQAKKEGHMILFLNETDIIHEDFIEFNGCFKILSNDIIYSFDIDDKYIIFKNKEDSRVARTIIDTNKAKIYCDEHYKCLVVRPEINGLKMETLWNEHKIKLKLDNVSFYIALVDSPGHKLNIVAESDHLDLICDDPRFKEVCTNIKELINNLKKKK